ncbi:RNA polymerase sigma factor [Roseivirga sp.]|uniref:RNA polymerase sigma factor n=1 Tax=Roseivirga sp. TaxID=1964215 RepID=UPI003B8C4C50
MKKDLSDKEIVDLIHSDEKKMVDKAFYYLYSRDYQSIRKFINSNSGTDDCSQEVFQETLIIFFVKVQKGLYKLEGSVGGYLFSIARNLWLKELQKRRLSIFTSIDDGQDYFEEENILVSHKKLKKVLKLLGVSCKRILEDFYFLKQTIAELTEKHGLGSEAAMKNKKYRCLKGLIELVNKNKLERSDFSEND